MYSTSLSGWRLLLLLVATHLSAGILAQHQDTQEKPATWRGGENTAGDTTSILFAFKAGTMHGHFRYFFMATDNAPGLSDYYANAAGGGLRFTSRDFHGFSTRISGFYVFNIGSSDLGLKDSLTGQSNRYEGALFDIENPYNHSDIDRLEELELRYTFSNTQLQFGRMLVNTPFINLQDGRMRPSGVEGFWFTSSEWKNLSIEGGYLYAFSPRGTTLWYKRGESIGVYPTGVNTDGSRSGYKDHTETKGVGVLGITVRPSASWKLQGWSVWIENVQHSALLQADADWSGQQERGYFAGIQAIRQDAVGQGGNEDPEKRYIDAGARAMTFGGRFGWKDRRTELSVNYNRITAHGRYLFPREWGRDPFYTFLPRERNDGFGDVHAMVLRGSRSFPKLRIKASLAVGHVEMPDVRDFRLNKYGLPSYQQANADIRYSFNGVFEGLEAQLLVVGKLGAGETYGNRAYVINKVDMVLYNLVVNYHF